MLEVRVEIMGYTLEPDLHNHLIEFKLRTPWKRGVSHDFKNKYVTLVVTQEEFDNHKIQHLGDRPDVLLFIEVWDFQDNLDMSFREGDSVANCSTASLAGLVRCNLNDQLTDHNLSPSIQWLSIHDPIRNSDKGKILIRVWTTFGDFRIRRGADDAKPTNMKSKLNSSGRVGPGPDGQKAHQNCPPEQSQRQPQLNSPKSITSIPSQPDSITTTFANTTWKAESTSTCHPASETGIGTCNTVATNAITSSRSGTASSGSSVRSRRIAADIYHD